MALRLEVCEFMICPFLGAEGGYHPRGDRKSAEDLDSKAVAGAPLRKRVCISMKTISLQVCNKKQTS